MILKNKIKELVNVSNEVPEEIQKLSNEENTAVITFLASYTPLKIGPKKSLRTNIGFSEEFGIEETIIEIKKQCPNINKLFFLINSPGGSIDTSFCTAKLLQKSFSDITVFVPHI